jgi:hypothetical protein
MGSEPGHFAHIATSLGSTSVPSLALPDDSPDSAVVTPFPNLGDALGWDTLALFRYSYYDIARTNQTFENARARILQEIPRWETKVASDLARALQRGRGGRKLKVGVVVKVGLGYFSHQF